ncbi:NAD(P)-binding protein [Wallemia mellicola CBS 633.66]|uniref:NAD(P)-binding protein n=1 Tax=Wallemia mellicola (strain ATCC MYA-4683 / CBS 633.66) TaxID=671144 RepID=I4YJG5_WALMC|nr:NAD(P)-binding protein [Wallemia mellicola CBS 633.66]EIM24107.1 NAD(P)-binding protein [Wallemia mellicola CBS 633.66]|eukprot:XP_006955933.1 NAD(P)-binding protein [Wallemia mellicola CBS 633.66]
MATKAGEEATKNINADKAAYVQTDITSEESVKNAMKVASNAFEKRLSGLVHCAGIAMSQPWTNRLEDTIGRSRRLLEINYMGTCITNALFADAVNERFEPEKMASGELFTTKEERGAIINFSSIAGHQPYTRILAYTGGKAAVSAFSRALADFLGPSGENTVLSCPKRHNSANIGARLSYFLAELTKTSSFPARPITPDEIAGAVNYLITNGMMNDHDLRIDGGWRFIFDRIVDREDPRLSAPGLE